MANWHRRYTAPMLVVILLSAWGTQTMATEEPVYETIHTTADYELRRYAPHRVAEVTVSGAFEQVGNEAFRMLAGYIFGDNRGEAKIAMTAPVSQRPAEAVAAEGTRIAMTAPVSQRPAPGQADRYVVSFAMPAAFTLDTLPVPNNPRIVLREEPARRVAARRYSGSWSEAHYREEERHLLEALRRDGLQPQGAPIYARYNSPFALPLFRRNEVLVEIETPAAP